MLSKRKKKELKDSQMLSKGELNESKLYQKELDKLKNTFPKQRILSMNDLANVLSMDIFTFQNRVKEGLELPKQINIGSTLKDRKSLRFTLEEVAKYIVKCNNKRDDSFSISSSLLNELKAIIAKIEKSKK